MRYPAKCVVLIGLLACICLSPAQARATEQSPNKTSEAIYPLYADDLYSADTSVSLDHTVIVNLINQVPAVLGGKVVFYQRNQYGVDRRAVAWRVYSLGCTGCTNRFSVSPGLNLSVINSHGSSTSQQAAQLGQIYGYDVEYSGGYLYLIGPSSSSIFMLVENKSASEQIAASLLRDGKLLAVSDYVPPAVTIGFELDSTLYVGIISNVQEGSLFDPAVLGLVSSIDLSSIESVNVIVSLEQDTGGYVITIQPNP